MKATFVAIILFCVMAGGAYATDVDVGMSVDEGGLKGFYLMISRQYGVPEKEIVVVQKRIPNEELPVVYFLARRAGVAPQVVIDLRLGGRSWLDISAHFGYGPDIYYVPVKEVKGPPYGKAYGYYKNKPRNKWHTIVLSDNDVVNLVNLKFVSEYYGYPPEKVIQMRSEGKKFWDINDEIVKEKKKGKSEESGSGKQSSKKKSARDESAPGKISKAEPKGKNK